MTVHQSARASTPLGIPPDPHVLARLHALSSQYLKQASSYAEMRAEHIEAFGDALCRPARARREAAPVRAIVQAQERACADHRQHAVAYAAALAKVMEQSRGELV